MNLIFFSWVIGQIFQLVLLLYFVKVLANEARYKILRLVYDSLRVLCSVLTVGTFVKP